VDYRILYAVDPNQPAARVQIARASARRVGGSAAVDGKLLSLFALLALTIAATGIGGVMALAVGQRRHEIGVRMAIGARPGEILRMVLGQGMVLGSSELRSGSLEHWRSLGLLQRLLLKWGRPDPLTFAGVAVVSAWLHSWRATCRRGCSTG